MTRHGCWVSAALLGIALVIAPLGISSLFHRKGDRLSLRTVAELHESLLLAGYFLADAVEMSEERDLRWIGDYVPPDVLFRKGLEYRIYRKHSQPLIGKRNVDIAAVLTDGTEVCWLKINNNVLRSGTCN